MSTLTRTTPAQAGDRSTIVDADESRDRSRRRALRVTAGITLASLALLADLLLVRHTTGGEIWGPITAALAVLTGALSLAFLSVRGHNRAIRIGLIALWLTIAFFGFGGYNDHRVAPRADAADQRPRPPLAPLVFTGMGLAGAVVLRSGTKGN